MAAANSEFSLENVLSALQGVRKNGREYLALCPGHPDKHPSLSVSLGQNGAALVYCLSHGCDVFPVILDHIREMKRAGVTPAHVESLPAVSTEKRRRPNVSESQIEQWAGRLQDELADPFSGATEYFARRGITAETLAALRVGYAAHRISHTNDAEERKLCSDCQATIPVVVLPRYRGSELRGVKYRALDPVGNHKWSQALGSTACQFLYGLDRARVEILDETCFIVEGEHEALLAWSLNINATAIFGTSGVPRDLTGEFSEDLETLKREFSRIVLIPDGGNDAGVKAMTRISGWLGDFPHSTITVPGFKDFGDFFQAEPENARAWIYGVRDKSEQGPIAVTTENAPKPLSLVAPSLDSIEDEPIDWLWAGYIPQKLTILAGAPGTGKSTLAYNLSATVTRGGEWPDGTRATQGRVLIWSSEDTAADIIKPRLRAAGADLSRCHILQSIRLEDEESRPFDPATDIPSVRSFVQQHRDVRLLVVDPIVSAVAGDMHKANDVRRALQQIVDFAGEFGVAVIGISHFAKGTGGRETTERVIGSQAFGAAPRMVLVTAKSSETGECVLARAKSNIAPDTGGFKYDLDLVSYRNSRDQLIETTSVRWGERVEGPSREILGGMEGTQDRSQIERAEAFLTEEFQKSPELDPKAVLSRAKSDWNIGEKSVRAAARKMGVRFDRRGYPGVSTWVLPTLVAVARGNENETTAMTGETLVATLMADSNFLP